MATDTSMMVADSSPVPHRSGPMSDGNSSSLSELDDMLDDLDNGSDQDAESIKDNDTEAETERIDPSPAKTRLAPHEAVEDPVDDDEEEEEEPRRESSIVAPEIEPLSPVGEALEPNTGDEDEPMPDVGEVHNEDADGLPEAESPLKRKRSSSLSDIDDNSELGDEPVRKRSASKRLGGSVSPAEVKEITSKAPAETEEASELSDAGNEEDVPVEELIDAPVPLRKSKRRTTHEEAIASPDPAEEHDALDNDDVDDEDAVVPEGEHDDAEAAARSEEEMAKKKVAMDNFKGIETKWAIFRDRLFDERLKELAAIQEDLEKDEPTNAVFRSQQRCLDERRDEKIRIEDRALFYKSQALERKTLAERAISHSKFAQDVRDARDDHLSKLNEDFMKIQRERRQSKTKEPQYSHMFNPNRPQQIANQSAYNKEISLLSGIARHKGFPGAPELDGADAGDIEADLKRMNIKPNATAYSQIASSKHYDEMAGEGNFLAKNAWARNPPLPPQVLQERPGLVPGLSEVATPLRNDADAPQMTASASAIGMTSEPAARSFDAAPTNSSPLNESRRQSLGGGPSEKPKNALGIFNPHEEQAQSALDGKSAAPQQSTASKPSYLDHNGEKRDEAAKGSPDEPAASSAYPLSGGPGRDRPQFGPLPGGITMQQGGPG